MGLAGVRRIAERAHRGWLYAGTGHFIAHLERVAGQVEELGGTRTAVQAAWLYAVPTTGIGIHDLVMRSVPLRVAEVVDVLQQRPDEYLPAFTERILRDRRAALVRYAILTDRHTYLHGRHEYERLREQHQRLADDLGLPAPAAEPAAAPMDVEHLLDWRPAGSEHWGPAARYLMALRGPLALPVLLRAYRRMIGDPARGCCLRDIRSAIYAIVRDARDVPAEQLADLSQRWWASTDVWEERVAVIASAATKDTVNRAALSAKLDSPDQWVVVAAIDAMTGPGDPADVEALRRVVARPDDRWRWAQRAAARRLADIGGPAAERALTQRYLNPLDPPWRDDRDWLHRHETEMIPVLIERLADPSWWFEAPFALGELRAMQAVGPICDALQQVSFGTPHIDALGRIGSAEAVPTLLDQARHRHQDVRDHALRALDRIGDPRVIDAAIAACDDPHPVVRDRAARVLTRHGDERAVPQLIRLCDGQHAARAAETLARIGDLRAGPTLWHLFNKAPDRRTRHAAGRGLARMDVPQEQLHGGGDVRVRRAFIWLLGQKRNWEAGHRLTTAVADDDPIVRARAAEALGRRGDRAAAEQVRGLLDDPDPRVQVCAAIAWNRIGESDSDTPAPDIS